MKQITILMILLLTVGVVAGQFPKVTADIRATAQGQTTVEGCARVLTDQYPEADRQRIVAYCEQLMTKAQVRTQIQQMPVDKRQMLLEQDTLVQSKLRTLSQDQLQKLSQLDEEQIRKIKAMDRARLQQVFNNNDVKSALGDYEVRTYESKEAMFRSRTVTNAARLRQRYNELEEEYREMKQRIQQHRQDFKTAVDEGDDEATLERARAYLTEVADMVINTLERVKTKVEENDDLTEEQVAEITADIDAKIETMQEAKADVEAAQTKEEMKEAGRVITQAWAQMKVRVRLHTTQVVESKVHDVLRRSTVMESMLEHVLTRLEEEGYDTSALDSLVTEFSMQVEDAREKFDEADLLLQEAKETTPPDTEKIQEARSMIQDAHSDLREAHETLKEIYRQVREMTGSFAIVSQADVDLTLVEQRKMRAEDKRMMMDDRMEEKSDEQEDTEMEVEAEMESDMESESEAETENDTGVKVDIDANASVSLT